MGEVILYDNYSQNNASEDLSFIEFIRQSEYNFKSCIIIGYIQKWDGKHTIEPVETEGLIEAIYRCTDKCDYVKIKFEEDHLELECSHHDGTNIFQIYLLSEEGYNAYEEYLNVDYSEDKYHEKMILDKLLNNI